MLITFQTHITDETFEDREHEAYIVKETYLREAHFFALAAVNFQHQKVIETELHSIRASAYLLLCRVKKICYYFEAFSKPEKETTEM